MSALFSRVNTATRLLLVAMASEWQQTERSASSFRANRLAGHIAAHNHRVRNMNDENIQTYTP